MSDGTFKGGEYFDSKDEEGQSEGNDTQTDGDVYENTVNETRGGYGKPTKGEYNTADGGYKTSGSEG